MIVELKQGRLFRTGSVPRGVTDSEKIAHNAVIGITGVRDVYTVYIFQPSQSFCLIIP